MGVPAQITSTDKTIGRIRTSCGYGNVCVWTPLAGRGSDSQRASVRSHSACDSRADCHSSGGFGTCEVSASSWTHAKATATSTAPVVLNARPCISCMVARRSRMT